MLYSSHQATDRSEVLNLENKIKIFTFISNLMSGWSKAIETATIVSGADSFSKNSARFFENDCNILIYKHTLQFSRCTNRTYGRKYRKLYVWRF